MPPPDDGWKILVRRLRDILRLRQAPFADLLDTTQTTVSRWETGAQLPGPLQQHRILTLLAQYSPPIETVLIESVRHDLGWSLITDAHFRLIAASPRVLRTYGPDLQEGASCWGLLGTGGDTHARQDANLGMSLGLVLLRQHLVETVDSPPGHLFAVQDHPIPTAAGEYLTMTRGYLLTPEEAETIRASGWETTLYSAALDKKAQKP